MLDFSWSHILILLVVALVVVGPKDLPRLMRIVGQWMGKARSMAEEFRRSFDDMARQSELEELRKEIDNLRHQRPLADIENELNRSVIPDDMKSAPATSDPVMTPPATAPVVEIENPPAPRAGEFEAAPHYDEPAMPADPESVAVGTDGFTPPTP